MKNIAVRSPVKVTGAAGFWLKIRGVKPRMADRTNTNHGENAREDLGRMEQTLNDLVLELRQQNNRENRRPNVNLTIQASLTERFMKLQPPTFVGVPKVDEVETWIIGIEDIFESESYSEIVNMALILERNNEEYVKEMNQKKRSLLAKKTGETSNKRREPQKARGKEPEQDKPEKCQRCGGRHKDEQCRWNTGACFGCGKTGH
ncbi:hypothetical protein F0562_003275 [Nyssa sinensis]|uniref:CCHC-type domain-containing protein n=1 Tax=Nyssa sinensis TaxID=561372 RepID=A0A5J5BVY7_9ASTE|nr:hypothetical protein F0562_003275 [Nyssa sinensis]